MSETLIKIIEEKQKSIDDLLEGNKKLIERAAKVFKQNEELFESMAKLLDFPISQNNMSDKEWQQYGTLYQEVRHQMWEAGYCLQCYNFICECDGLD